MLSGESILCFAPDPWDDIWRNRHQIMSLLSEHNQVLYVEPRPYLRLVVRQALGRELSWAKLTAPRLTGVKPGLQVFHPPLYAPLSGREPVSTLTRALREASLRRAMRLCRISEPILWLFRPEMADVPGRYGERLLIYHIVDEYLGYADFGAERANDIRRRERELIDRADLVLVTSRELLESKGGINPNTHWVPNGVAYQRFADVTASNAEPRELEGLPRPRIGYVGAINDKIDAHLLLQVAKAYAQASIVLVGPMRVLSEDVARAIGALRTMPNVHFVGRVSAERVPLLVAGCDVGLLPYQRNAWTRNIHPLKMYEYLACGLPVVSTDIPAVHDEEGVIYIADDSEAFVSAIARALSDNSEALARIRQARASRNTWRHRVEHISELIEMTLAGGSAT